MALEDFFESHKCSESLGDSELSASAPCQAGALRTSANMKGLPARASGQTSRLANYEVRERDADERPCGCRQARRAR